MQIGEPMLQLLLYKKAQREQQKATENTTAETEPTNTAENVVLTNTTPTSEDYKTADAFAMEKLSESQKIQITKADTKLISKHSITLSELSATDISNIKQVIYNLHHNPPTNKPSGGTTPPITPPVTPPAEEEPTTDGGKISFISDFNDVDSMFTFLSTTYDPAINAENGISHSDLIYITQNDDWEKNNYEFFGKLNLAFNDIDTNGNGNLSYDEIKAYIGDEIATASEYDMIVESYSNELQTAFQYMSADEKLDFAIEKAYEYLTTAGFPQQISALDRLIAENKLGFTDLNPDKTYTAGESWTLGAYQYWINTSGNWLSDEDDFQDLNNDGYDDKTGLHWSDSEDFWDEDGDGKDDYFGGIFLDKYYYLERPNSKWYELVSTLIHELTHATASFNPSDSTKWGEYVAYQTEEDYLDSISKGDYYGENEKSKITAHINDLYDYDANGDGDYTDPNDNLEPVPTFKWWTYS